MRRAMQGQRRPTTKSPRKATRSTPANQTTPRLPMTQRSSGGRESATQAPLRLPEEIGLGTCGSGMPSEEIVEQTQKALKQEKPVSSRADVRMIGSCISTRTKWTSKMYANMSGDAHLEMCCTEKMKKRARETRYGLLAFRRSSPSRSIAILTPGMTMAYSATSTAPLLEPVVYSRCTKPVTDSVQDLWPCCGWMSTLCPSTSTTTSKLKRMPERPGISSA
mmetsp:Transcript_11681/g.29984  ORF Transcript_11681/g.29984 Transcript_11681/m.29984 type:complete len:221 (-) Transcript_11681:131-793(-)